MQEKAKVSCLKQKFAEVFGGEPEVYRAPGRINLIGEHTDYNDGFVMPAAIDRYTWTAIRSRVDQKVRLHSTNLSTTEEFDLSEVDPVPSGGWLDYPRGVAIVLKAAGYDIRGADILISGEVPIGGGLSSSAALEVSTAYALLDQSAIQTDLTNLAKLCQRAENDFVGMRCGLMDQFAACHGVAGNALALDCRSLEYDLVEIPADIALLICNTMVKHELAGSEYNSRRADCEEGVRVFSRRDLAVVALRDVTMDELDRRRSELPERIFWHCRHVITENERVQKGVVALKAGNIEAFGSLMYESHRSLRDDYEVSSPELNLMVQIASMQKGVIGARMTGGGFGGCTVNLVEREEAESFTQAVSKEYESRTGLAPEIYLCNAAGGVERASELNLVAEEALV